MNILRLPNEAALKEFLERTNCKVHEPRAVKGPCSAPEIQKNPAPKARTKPTAPKAPRKPMAQKKAKPARKGSALEESMWEQIQASDLPTPERQIHYLPSRNYRGDFGWRDLKLALEVDGAVHRIQGSFDKSFARAMVLLIAGWTVLHVGGHQVRDGSAMKWLLKLYAARTA